ncbi:MAG: PepSY domain-containing protein, partial [Peptostreptococcaceae bacterium]
EYDNEIEDYTKEEKVGTNNQNTITLEEAKEIALQHANLTMEDVKFLKEEESLDDGVEKYDIEFFNDNKEYDYEIDALTGEIIEYDNEIEDYTKEENVGTNNQNTITLEEAKGIALKDASLTKDQVSFIKEEKTTDSGKEEYNIKFTYNNVEYDYEVDAVTGDIIEFDKE